MDTPLRWGGIVLLGMVFSAGPVLACTSAELALGHDGAEAEASAVQMNLAARLDARAGMGPADGLKLRMRQQDTVLSAYVPPTSAALGAPARSGTRPASTDRNPALAERSPAVSSVQPASDSTAEHAYKPLAMLAAALAVMVSIALRRSGKR